MTDLTKVADALFQSVKGYVSRSLEPIAARVQALEKREPERGERGEPGPSGEAGRDGAEGAPGASAYALAVAAGFDGDEAAWLLSLQGDRGADASLDLDAIHEAIGLEVSRAVASLPSAKDGKDADPQAVAELVAGSMREQVRQLVEEQVAAARERAAPRVDRSFSERVSKALGHEVQVVAAEEFSHG